MFRSATPEGAYIAANGYLVFARSADVAENGGIENARTFDFGLTNVGDILVLKCAGVELDRVDYGADGFPRDAQGIAIQLNPERLNAQANDAGDAWCAATTVYPAGGEQQGTPGVANSECPWVTRPEVS